MADIRRKGVITTTIIYIGFLIGAINNLLLTKQGFFTTDQYGLSKALIDIGIMFSAFAALGSNTVLIKFLPYHKKHLSKPQNDLFTLCFVITTIGILLVMVAAYMGKPYVLQKFGANAPQLVQYFYWSFLIAVGTLYFGLLESYSWFFQMQIQTNLLKETILRGYTFLVIGLKIFNVINFTSFITLFALQYIVIAAIMFYLLFSKGHINFVFKISRVTKRFKKQIIALLLYGFSFVIVSALKSSIDSLLLGSLLENGLQQAGVFTFAAFSASLISAPYRSIASISIPLLSIAWRDKNLAEINRLYKRSSINLLMFALFAFGIIVLNFKDAILFFGLNADITNGFWCLVVSGACIIVECGTGINGQIIATSTKWRFEFYTNVVLCGIMIPASYLLTKQYGIIGPALGTLFGYIIYNTIRIVALYKWYAMQPFNNKTLVILILSICSFTICYLVFPQSPTFLNLALRSILYTIVFVSGVLLFNISPDVKPVLNTILKRTGFKK
jgi:O-antigen/teichoic acid export membrane protein